MKKVYQDKKEPEITAVYKVRYSEELLNFLISKCNTSRNNVKSLLTKHQVLVNGSPVSQYNFLLAKDDEVKIAKRPMQVEQRIQRREVKRASKIEILYEDKDFIAINKPNGLLSVESDKETENAFAYVFTYLQSKNKLLRPYILHRIDKETSGVLVFAKDVRLHSMLKMNWNEYVKDREYIAIVEGTMEKKEKRIVSFLKENQNNLVYSVKDPSGQKAITNYKVIKSNGQFSMLQVHIETGRKNQIRIAMHDLKHPIIGDEKYGFTKNPLKRLGLHASRLEFIHPITNQSIVIEAPVPRQFINLFEKKTH